MTWNETHEDDITILHLEGDIDLNHSPKLRSLFQTKIQAKCPALLINFAKVNYIDSSGLATLVEYFQGSRGFAGKIALAELSPRVRSVFDLVRLGEIFTIYDSTDSAREQMAQETVSE